jgi:predicted site-specific integrase-resolvase
MSCDPDEPLLTLREAARLSGFAVVTWRRWIRTGRVSARRLGLRRLAVAAADVKVIMAGGLTMLAMSQSTVTS